MKNLVLTTLNNNDEFYFRCFIPFILSLRKTNYQGDIGVIDYGLSDEKKAKIIQNGILVFTGENRFSELLMDRQTTVGLIAEQYGYEQIALYDADIWFPHKQHTIFEKITDSEKLYCSHDVICPSFLTACLSEHNFEYINSKLEYLLKKIGAFYQVGVIVGHRQGWLNYRNYIINDLDNLNGYKMLYGTDTTAINLYAVDTDNISYLPKKYNCLPFWGINVITKYKQTDVIFKVDDEIVESFHITSNHRNNRRYYEHSYFSFCLDDYLTSGQSFNPNCLPLIDYAKDKSWLIQQNQQLPKLLIEELEAVMVRSRIDYQGILFEPNDLLIEFASNAKLTLRNVSEENISFNFILQELVNSHYPALSKLQVNNEKLTIRNNHTCLLTLKPEETFTFICDDVWQTDYGVRLVFSNIGLY